MVVASSADLNGLYLSLLAWLDHAACSASIVGTALEKVGVQADENACCTQVVNYMLWKYKRNAH